MEMQAVKEIVVESTDSSVPLIFSNRHKILNGSTWLLTLASWVPTEQLCFTSFSDRKNNHLGQPCIKSPN